MDKIKKLAIEYSKQKKRIGERRDEWSNNKFQFVYDTLKELEKDVELDWLSGKDATQPNRTTTYLGFSAEPSGITSQSGSRLKHYVREGGYLCYSQSVDGKIVVWISFPYVEDLQSKPDNHLIEIIDPEEITKEKIIGHVEKFLDELNEERPESNEVIGFKIDDIEH